MRPDAQESRAFWSAMWDKEKEHKKDAEWLDELRAETDDVK